VKRDARGRFVRKGRGAQLLPAWSLAQLERVVPMAAKRLKELRAAARGPGGARRLGDQGAGRRAAVAAAALAQSVKSELETLHKAVKQRKRRRNPPHTATQRRTIKNRIASLQRALRNETNAAARKAIEKDIRFWAEQVYPTRRANPSPYKYVISLKGGPRVARFLTLDMAKQYAQGLANRLRRSIRVST
jgi:hypothetical protein